MNQPSHVSRRRKTGIKKLIGYGVVGVVVIFVTLATIIGAFSKLLPTKSRKSQRVPTRRILKWVFVLALLTSAGIGVFKWYDTMHDGSIYEVVSTTLETPAESSIALDEYQIAADLPRLITMPTAGVEGIVQRVTTEKDNLPASPNNVHAAGWYDKSVKPGEIGLSIISGYTQGKYSKGVFYNLATVKPRDRFSITYGDGSVRNFLVVSQRVISVRVMPTEMFIKDPTISRQLTLITNAGAHENGTEAFNARTIITASAQ